MKPSDPFEVLGVAPGTPLADIKVHYRALMRQWHPDVAGPAGTAKTAELNAAYTLVSDPNYRWEPEPEPEPEPEWSDDWGEVVDIDVADEEPPSPAPQAEPDTTVVLEPAILPDAPLGNVRPRLRNGWWTYVAALLATLCIPVVATRIWWTPETNNTFIFSTLATVVAVVGVHKSNSYMVQRVTLPRVLIIATLAVAAFVVPYLWMPASLQWLSAPVASAVSAFFVSSLWVFGFYSWRILRNYMRPKLLRDPEVVYGPSPQPGVDTRVEQLLTDILGAVPNARLVRASTSNPYSHAIVAGRRVAYVAGFNVLPEDNWGMDILTNLRLRDRHSQPSGWLVSFGAPVQATHQRNFIVHHTQAAAHIAKWLHSDNRTIDHRTMVETSRSLS